jgi:hypothetical protein
MTLNTNFDYCLATIYLATIKVSSTKAISIETVLRCCGHTGVLVGVVWEADSLFGQRVRRAWIRLAPPPPNSPLIGRWRPRRSGVGSIVHSHSPERRSVANEQHSIDGFFGAIPVDLGDPGVPVGLDLDALEARQVLRESDRVVSSQYIGERLACLESCLVFGDRLKFGERERVTCAENHPKRFPRVHRCFVEYNVAFSAAQNKVFAASKTASADQKSVFIDSLDAHLKCMRLGRSGGGDATANDVEGWSDGRSQRGCRTSAYDRQSGERCSHCSSSVDRMYAFSPSANSSRSSA